MSETAQLKHFQQQRKMKTGEAESSSAPPTMASTTATSTSNASIPCGRDGVPKPPPEIPKESVVRRYKFIWPLLLGVNIAVGAYLFTRTKKKDMGDEEQGPIPSSSTSQISSATPSAANVGLPSPSVPTTESFKSAPPIPEHQQRELFKWILEEKRKIKPKDPEEKRRIDEEKAILKQFIRAKRIPSV